MHGELPSPAACAKGYEGVPFDMNRIHPECRDSDPSDRLVAADFLFRQEPDEEEEEDEDEDEDEGDGKDDKDDDGYSE